MAGPSHDSQRQVKLNFELPSDLDAVYANIALITHSPSEVIIDFGRVLPNVPKAKIYARIILTPMSAKLLHQALGENLDKFETKFGKIQTQQDGFEEQRSIGFQKQT
jgi:hypothetical protein